MNILNENLIRVQLSDGEVKCSLPGVFAGLSDGTVAGFPALRAHQRHAWHAFLVQLAAMAMHNAGLTALPEDEAAWRNIFLNLTPGEAGQTAWNMTAPADRPAFLQPPIPDGLAALKKLIPTPDGIDMLVSSRNHDLKQANMVQAAPDDWLFALLTLQTMEGFLGAGNYGISRMNGGFANRPALGVAPPGGLGAHFRRDVLRLLAIRSSVAQAAQAALSDGICLVWLYAWDGTKALKPATLDPYYIEICRRIRLVEVGSSYVARAGSSKCARIESTPGGITGDPWAPVKIDKDGIRKVFTLDATGFTYRRMVELIFAENGFEASLLQKVVETDATEGLVLLARGLVRGQGKTEGYHERLVPLSRIVRRGLRADAADPVAEIAKQRVLMAGEVQRHVLKRALFSLFQNGPDKIDFGQDSSNRKANAFLAEFDSIVDIDFFRDLWWEAEAEAVDDKRAARRLWLAGLLKSAEAIVRRVDTAAPKSSHRHYRALARALDELRAAPWRNEMLKTWMPDKPEMESHHAA